MPDVRKEVLSESEKEAQQAVRVVQTEMGSVLAVNKEILGKGSPGTCENFFDERAEKLEKELEERQEAKKNVEAMQEAIEGITPFSIVDNKKVYI